MLGRPLKWNAAVKILTSDTELAPLSRSRYLGMERMSDHAWR